MVCCVYVISLASVFCSRAASNSPSTERGDIASLKEAPERMICSFETADGLGIFGENLPTSKDEMITLTNDHVTAGKWSCKFSFPSVGDWPGLELTDIPNDWSKYNWLKVDIYNPSPAMVRFNAKIEDSHTVPDKNGDKDLLFWSQEILPGANTFAVELSDARTFDELRFFDLKTVKTLRLFLLARPDDAVLYLDNIRLTKEPPPSVSRTPSAKSPTAKAPNDSAVSATLNRFLYGNWPATTAKPSIRVVDSFEQDIATIEKNWMTKSVTLSPSLEHVTDGKHSLKADFHDHLGAIAYRPRWANYWSSGKDRQLQHYRLLFADELKLDVFNPGPPVSLVVKTTDDHIGHWRQREVSLKSGKNTVTLTREELFRDMFRDCLVLYNILFRPATDTPTTLYFDNFRLVGPGLGENLIAKAKCIDFGPESMTRSGFLPSDSARSGQEYTKQRGYGWKSISKKTRKLKPNWREPDGELIRDNAPFNRPFLIDLPDGKYRLQLVEGFRGYSEFKPGTWDLSIRINGSQPELLRRGVRSIDELTRLEYAGELIDCQYDQDKWDNFAAKIFRPLEHDFDVTGGQARIELVTDPPGSARVSFLIIYPLADAKSIEPEIAALWRDIKYRFNQAYNPFTRPMAERLNLPALHEEYMAPDVRKRKIADIGLDDSNADCVVFSRAPQDDVYIDTVPSPGELTREVASFCPPGETEPLTLSVFANRETKDASLTVGDFKSTSGATIPASSAEVFVVGNCYRANAQVTHGDWKYIILPWYLTRTQPISIRAKTSRRFWINVRVPDDTPAGEYTAQAEFKGEQLAAVSIPIKLTVLPFKLDPVPEAIDFCALFGSYSHNRPLDAKVARLGRFGPAASKRWQSIKEQMLATTTRRMQAHIDMARDYGFTSVSDKNKPPKEVKLHGLKYVNYRDPKTSPDIQPLGNMTHMRPAKVAEAHQAGKRALLNGRNNLMVFQQGSLYRFQAGFFLWRLGADGVMFGPWQFYFGDPYSAFDGHKSEPGWFATYSATDWPRLNPALILEGTREGIKDFRYLSMLKRLAEEKKGTEAAATAQAYLDRLNREIHPAGPYYFTRIRFRDSGPSWALQTTTGWQGDRFEQNRREIIGIILKLLEK